ncbi:unnamed protein product [Lymnaea stagnalis]|uniref:Uncharacterized protein n=1 Tax=Lymnaea stagnalis TaxID=6523 RepID=A0AAV2I3W0_LYMST
MLGTLCTLLVLAIGTTVNAQYGYCGSKYFICDFWRPCCGGGLDPLVCVPSRGYTSYCYPYSEYLAYVNSQKTTSPSSSKECAGLYQSCDFVSCCEDPTYPKYCAGTAQGKFCFLKQSVNTESTSAAPDQTSTPQVGTPQTSTSQTGTSQTSTPQTNASAAVPTTDSTTTNPANDSTPNTATTPTTASLAPSTNQTIP